MSRKITLDALLSFLEHEADPMIVMDPDYSILAANPAYLKQFGRPGTDVAGQKCFRVSHGYDHPCDQSGEHCPMAQARANKRPDRVLHVHHTPRGPEHVDVELRPILNARQQVIAYVERLKTVHGASPSPRKEGLVGRSAAFNEALSQLNRVAASPMPVLLLGESGTGKELFARALHEASDRAGGPFVVVDCSGLTETLFESELFGHEKGAFTGATHRKNGLVETAHGGTLFLDEIGDVPLGMQVKLLRLIETSTYRRVGSVDLMHADFRLVAATHKDLQAMMQAGSFRGDLYYRISAFPISLPPLRGRREDIPLLVDSMVRRGAGGRDHTVSSEAMRKLQVYDWPGNIRELKNVIDRACVFADDRVIRPEHLPAAVLQAAPLPRPPDGLRHADAELAQLAASFRGSRRELAAQLGLSERTLYRRLKSLGVGNTRRRS
jgi:transcriptional regulator with PAS, ATPase and Fis domain